MDTVTYPSKVVQSQLQTHWLTIKIDVDQRTDIADTCNIHGIPAVVAISPDGNVLGKVLGFVEPTSFAAQLLQLRTQ